MAARKRGSCIDIVVRWQAFDYGYIVLQQAAAAGAPGVLGRVLRVTDHVLQYRRWVRDTFHPYFFPPPAPPRPHDDSDQVRTATRRATPHPAPPRHATPALYQLCVLQEWSSGSVSPPPAAPSPPAAAPSPPPLSALQCSSPTPRRVSAHQSLIIHHITSNSDFNNIPSGTAPTATCP